MTESTARAERFDVQTAASPFYLWEVAQKPVSVRIPFNLIDRLEHEAVESFRSLTSRGSEIGGLLVGDVAPGNPPVVSIADYELIPCDYSRGPLYRLSDADSGRFEHAIQQRLASGRAVAGFFRSQTRKGLCLDAEDLAFFQARFHDPHHLALLIRPFATKASTAGIFIWENGKVNGESSYREFPFRSSELGSGQAPGSENFKTPAPPAAAPPVPKAPSRAQIVPIASRREISLPPVPAAEPAPPAAVVAAPPLPAPEAVAAPPAPAPPATVPAVAEKPAKPEKAVKTEKAPIVASESVATAPARTEPTEELRSLALPASLEPEILTPASGGKGMKLLVAAAASIALFVALFVYPGFLRSNNKPAPVTARQDSSPLQLRVERANGELLLTWNPDAEAVRNASKAVLTIADGDQRENVAVDTAQLASGRIVYLPSGTDISFKLEVTDKSQKKTTSESVRMLRTRPSPLQEQNDAAAAKAAALAAGNKAAAPVTNPATGLNPEEQPVAEQPAKPAPTPLKPFKTESLSQRLRPAANTDMPDAPAVNAGDRSTPSAIPGVNVNAVVPAPMAPAPPAPVATDSKPKSGGNIQQAVLIYRKDAEYPKLAKQTGAKGTVVLSATIGKDGAIKAVKVISGHSMLTKAAADAVKQWRYKPTMLNGQPVEAETQVLVNFVGDR